MSTRKNVSGSKSFPWKVVFGAISIIGVMVLLSTSNNSSSTDEDGSFSKTGQNNLSGFSLRK
jgi:hypothetical protein